MTLNLYDFNKLILKNITILIPKYKENMLSFLAPVIGIYGIKINLFIDEFEKKTNFLDIDIVIPVKVIIYKINTFDLIIELPYLNFFLNEFYNNLNILYIFKLSFLKSNLNVQTIYNNYKMIRSYIKSLQYLKNKFYCIKYNFLLIKNFKNFLFFKNLIINFNYIKMYLQFKFGYYVIINNLNFYKFLIKFNNFKILKIKKKANLFLFLYNNIDKYTFYFFKNLHFKNKLKLINVKYNLNKINIYFFDKNFILNIFTVNNFLFICFYLLFKFINFFNFFNKFLFNLRKI